MLGYTLVTETRHPSLTLPIVNARHMAVALVGPVVLMLCAKQVNAEIVSWA